MPRTPLRLMKAARAVGGLAVVTGALTASRAQAARAGSMSFLRMRMVSPLGDDGASEPMTHRNQVVARGAIPITGDLFPAERRLLGAFGRPLYPARRSRTTPSRSPPP